MSITHRLRRPTPLCAVVCALLMSTTTGAAVAGAAPVAQERYLQSYGPPDPAPVEERYYSSYGEPEPLAVQPQAPSHDTQWLPITLAIAAALAVVAASATQLRRIRIRRRGTARTAA